MAFEAKGAESSHDLASLNDLPYDLVRALCTLLSGADIAHMFMTCKDLYSHMSDEAVWKELCVRYDVGCTSSCGGGTFFRLYSIILHPYGPLLGLWASDHPFRGGIIEFRVDSLHQGIVGETWDFRNFNIPYSMLPNYLLFVVIALPALDSTIPHAAVLSWTTSPLDFWGTRPTCFIQKTETTNAPTLHVLSETNATTYVHHAMMNAVTMHPDFPAPGLDAWYDHSRGLPRLVVHPSPDVSSRDHEFFRKNLEMDHRRAISYITSGPTTKPAALCIRTARGEFHPLVHYDQAIHAHDFSNYGVTSEADMFFNRYYPVRFEKRVGQPPAEDSWDPASLEGLWLGDYGPHGTELLSVEYDTQTRIVRAVKITGDENVPRGAVSWTIDLAQPMRLDDIPPDSAFGAIVPPRLYRGTGIICGTGYIEEMREIVENFVAITGEDEIKIGWFSLDPNDVVDYIRYMPRDIRW